MLDMDPPCGSDLAQDRDEGGNCRDGLRAGTA